MSAQVSDTPGGRRYMNASATHEYKVGDLVRLVQTRGYVKKADAGRLFTVRAFRDAPPDDELVVRVDDGDPSNPDIQTNMFTLACWLPLRAITPLSREGS